MFNRIKKFYRGCFIQKAMRNVFMKIAFIYS